MMIKEMFVTYTAGNGSGSTFNYDHANKIKDLVVGTSNSILLSETI